MFVNDPAHRRTVDVASGVELRFLASGSDRPNIFALTTAGHTIAFEATVRTVAAADGSQALGWTVHAVGVGHPFYGVNAHRFADQAERDSVLTLIGESLRAYRDLHGLITTPVAAVTFEPAAQGA